MEGLKSVKCKVAVIHKTETEGDHDKGADKILFLRIRVERKGN